MKRIITRIIMKLQDLGTTKSMKWYIYIKDGRNGRKDGRKEEMKMIMKFHPASEKRTNNYWWKEEERWALW